MFRRATGAEGRVEYIRGQKNGGDLLALLEKSVTFAVAFRHRDCRGGMSVAFGEMVEWSITPVLKTGVLRGTGGSNPSLSATSSDYRDLQDLYPILRLRM